MEQVSGLSFLVSHQAENTFLLKVYSHLIDLLPPLLCSALSVKHLEGSRCASLSHIQIPHLWPSMPDSAHRLKQEVSAQKNQPWWGFKQVHQLRKPWLVGPLWSYQ